MLQGSMEKNQYSIEIPPGRQGAILTVRSKYAIMSGRAELNRRPHGPEPCALTGLSHAPNSAIIPSRTHLARFPAKKILDL